MKYFTLLLLLFFTADFGVAQSLSISESSATSGNGLDQYMVSGHSVNITNNELSFAGNAAASSINDLTAVSAVLRSSAAQVYAGNGDELFSTSFNLEGDDSSAKIYAKLDGGFIIRENIANFLFYNSLGRVEQSISNSSQSTDGESISELAADPAFKTVVLFNPKIVRGGEEGSRAKLVKSDLTTSDIFYSSERAIRMVRVSDNGQFIGIATYRPGTNDVAIITDRFGNKLTEISFDQNIEDVVISEDGQFVTVRSNGRVGVYSVTEGEREGSASFRSTLIYAKFIPEDQTVIALTALRSGSNLTDVEVHAINIEARAIQRQSFNSQLSSTELIPVKITRNGSFRYSLTGLNKTLDLRVIF